MGFFTPDIPKLYKKKKVKKLVKALSYPNDSGIRYNASVALDKLGWKPSNTTEKSYYLLGKKSWEDLKPISDPAVDVLLKQMFLGEYKARREAVIIVGKLRNDKAIDTLINHIYNGSRSPIESSSMSIDKKEVDLFKLKIKTLKKFDKSKVNNHLQKLIQNIFTSGQDAVHPAQLLSAPSPDSIRSDGADILANMGDLIFYQLIKALKESDITSVREYSAYTLGKIGNEKAVPHLIQALHKNHWTVKIKVVTALEAIGGEEAKEGLLIAKDDGDEFVSSRAIEALQKMKD